jgi:predicted fused transcriptional regulator/phosphomethylpyrimidine kinase/predicted transcriptional regulator
LTPHELLAKHVIPPLRALVAHRLREYGFGQEKIARMLGVSQPLVSKYLREGREAILGKLGEAGVNVEEAISVADMLAARLMQNGYADYLEILTAYANSLLARGVLCRFHRRLQPGLPANCDICMRLFQPGFDPYLRDVEEAAKMLTSHPEAAAIIPNVGSNIVSAKPGAQSIAEVAGLTGAIVRVGGRAVAVGHPAYGGSRHTATVLLMVMRRWQSKRAALVVAYREECIDTARRLGLRVLEVGPHSSAEKFYEELAEALESAGGEVDVIADRGGVNLEPVIYIFARTAVEAANIALKCVEEAGIHGRPQQ